jgi:aspartate/glutamate/glutamine transport system permease protein
MITVIKDTSLLWGVQIEDFTGKGMILMGKFTTSTQIFLMFGFMALVYFLINFTLSVFVRRTQNKRLSART